MAVSPMPTAEPLDETKAEKEITMTTSIERHVRTRDLRRPPIPPHTQHQAPNHSFSADVLHKKMCDYFSGRV